MYTFILTLIACATIIVEVMGAKDLVLSDRVEIYTPHPLAVLVLMVCFACGLGINLGWF